MRVTLPANRYEVVSPVLTSWRIHDEDLHTDLNSCALLTPQGWWLVDPAMITDRALKYLLEGKPVVGILLTNENHERAAQGLAQKWNWPIYAHETARELMKLTPSFFFRDGEVLTGGIRIVHIPGASQGETCFHQAEYRLLIVGDALTHLPKAGLALLSDQYCHNPTQAKSAVKRLLGLEFDTLVFAHGPPIVGSGKKKLEALLSQNPA